MRAGKRVRLPRRTTFGVVLVTLLAALALASNPALAAPHVAGTSPFDAETNVPVNATIRIVFDTPIDPASLNWSITPFLPMAPEWSAGYTRLNLSHALTFAECRRYTVEVEGKDGSGTPLGPGPEPNPWSFSTESARPCITRTSPAHQERGVSSSLMNILVWFTAPVDHTAHPVSVAISPNPGPFSTAWSIPASLLTTSLFAPFPECAAFRVTVSDERGSVPGIVANPWWFSTTCAMPGPFIQDTDPIDGTADVPLDARVTVSFSEPVDPGSVTWTTTPSLTLAASWTGNATLLLTPSSALPRCTVITVTVYMPGLLLGPAPNPWTFRTLCFLPGSPTGLVATAGNRRVALAWSPPTDDGGAPIIGYRLYRGPTPGSEVWREDLPNLPSCLDLSVANGATYYYQVSAVNAVGEGARSLEANATPWQSPPTVHILAPADGGRVSGLLSIRGNASDPDGAVDHVEVRIDGGPWTNAQGAEAWSLTWNSSTVPDGAHTIEARAFDGEAYSAVAAVSITVANAPASGGAIVTFNVGPWLGLIVVVAAAAVLAALIALFLRRRRREEEPPEPGPPPP